MKPRILIIQNHESETLGLYEQMLREKTHLTLIHSYRMATEKQFPPVKNFDAFIVGPTPISANEVEKHGFLQKEWDYLKQVIEEKKPMLGVCCGGQIMSRLLGGEVRQSPMKEIGGYKVKLTEEGVEDPLFKDFPLIFPVFHWHSDMFTVPPGGKLLARGDPCPFQAYSYDNVRGILFHLEITTKEAERWTQAYPDEPEYIGKTVNQILAECRAAEPKMRKLAQMLVNNFLAMIPVN